MALESHTGRSPFAAEALERSGSDQTLSCLGSSDSLSSSCMSRQSSGDAGSWQPATKRDAKATNARLMQAHSPQEIFSIVVEHLADLDSINITAALQRLAKLLSSDDHHHPSGHGGHGDGAADRHALKEAVLASPVFQALASMMVEQCNSGLFNAQSTANAWWAVAKLHAVEQPASVEMVGALENALVACLTSPADSAKPNAQGVSSIWYSLGRLASDGYAPSPLALQLLWDRTHKLTLNFDSQGIANVLWAFGQLRKKHGEAFPVRTEVLASLSFVVQRIAPNFAVQGLSCSAVGCANLGPALRPAVLPLMLVLVRESLRRVHHFNLQAMANMTSAIARLAPLAEAEPTKALLAAFDAHAASLCALQKTQDATALWSALRACGVTAIHFKPGSPPPLRQGPPSGSVRDAGNSWSDRSSPAPMPSGGAPGGWVPPPPNGATQISQLAALVQLAGLGPSPPPQDQQKQPQWQQQAWQGFQAGLPPPLQAFAYRLPAPCGPVPSGRPPHPPHAASLPAPLLVLPTAGLPHEGGSAAPLSIAGYSYLAAQLAASNRTRSPPPHQPPAYVPPPPPPSAAAATTADPAYLKAILTVLQNLKAERQLAAAAAAGSTATA